MNSKINGVTGNSSLIDTQRISEVRPGATSKAGTDSARTDQVSLTDSAQLMVRLEQLVGDLPTVDRERVDGIKAAIANGSYTVDADRVATEVLRMELNLKIR